VQCLEHTFYETRVLFQTRDFSENKNGIIVRNVLVGRLLRISRASDVIFLCEMTHSCPASSANVPIEHFAHAPEDLFLNCPSGQSTHAVECEFGNFPSVHEVQTTFEDWSENLPTGQFWHLLPEFGLSSQPGPQGTHFVARCPPTFLNPSGHFPIPLSTL